MRVAIMQPTFLPWAGYFGLMDSVDAFVFLDHVAIDKRSWQTRNQIKTATGAKYLTVPVKATQGQSIGSVEIAMPLNKLTGAVWQNYGKAPYAFHAHTVQKILGQGHKYLCSLNLHLIEYFVKQLEIRTKLSCSSQMGVTGAKSELLANICRKVGATEYVSPPGSRDYLDAAVFDCPVTYFDFSHPVYRQGHGAFLPFMSALDLLCNEGPESLNIIRRGYAACHHPGARGVKKDTGKKHLILPRETDGAVDAGSRKIILPV